MKDITILEGIKKIIPLFKRTFRTKELLSLMEYSGLRNINKVTITRYLINLVKDNIILKSDFSNRIENNYYTLPLEKVTYNMPFSAKTNSYHNKKDKGTKFGTVYQVQMKNSELIELSGLSKLFQSVGSESINGTYDLYDSINPSSVLRLGSAESFIIHTYNDEIDYKISDENTITINSYRYGSYAQFIILNNWNGIERIRKHYIHYKLIDRDYIFPVKVNLMITDHKPKTVDYIMEQLRVLNSPIDKKTHKSNKGVRSLEEELQEEEIKKILQSQEKIKEEELKKIQEKIKEKGIWSLYNKSGDLIVQHFSRKFVQSHIDRFGIQEYTIIKEK